DRGRRLDLKGQGGGQKGGGQEHVGASFAAVAVRLLAGAGVVRIRLCANGRTGSPPGERAQAVGRFRKGRSGVRTDG
ncbi:hypothetical protein, partial [Brevundimonas aurantiaca]|uniref:hypothetical protein n=1 Tax=Brevundimonas aurantiaca TaxID=74316 RepID=UPI00174ADAC2